MAARALAVGVALTALIPQAMVGLPANGRLAVDQVVFLFSAAFVAFTLVDQARSRRRDSALPRDAIAQTARAHPSAVWRSRWHVAGAAVIAVAVVVQTVSHLDERGGYLAMTRPDFPVGAGAGADGYVFWLEGHPVYEEAWQAAKQAGLYAGAEQELTTGDHDARAGYSYLGALLAQPLGYFGAFNTLNVVWWLAAALATWYLAALLLGDGCAAWTAGALAACGQGFVFMASTPMSYVAGYAWAALLLALAARWRLFSGEAPLTRWTLWGWLCGVSGLFYFTHVVLVPIAWLLGLRRVPLRSLVVATALAFVVPGLWYLVGHYLAGLRFKETTANDLAGSVLRLVDALRYTPAAVPGDAGSRAVRALTGGFTVPVLLCAAAGVLTAPAHRRRWYLVTAICGTGPVFVLDLLPVTQRYGYLAYPAITVAAAEGAGWLGSAFGRLIAGMAPISGARWQSWCRAAALGTLALFQVAQANVDLLGVYHFALAFGGP